MGLGESVVFCYMKLPKPPNDPQYYLYLDSRSWARKRDLVIERDEVCQGCLCEPIEHVHHTTYTHCGDELLFQLVGLCENCHRKVHFIESSWNPYSTLTTNL